MEDDAGVKAPVTRLRRRISIEQSEESKSPAVSTPTKKRGGRRAAKPDLELIDENTPDTTTTKRTTKKAAVKDIIDTVEEKPLTPSRRSTRIKSNTSIVSETSVAVDSPRAKRAARRTSQIGSDSEAPPTPVRQTRRTRKDSTSSIEKGEIQPSTKPAIQITDVIIEEPESNTRKSTGETNENKTSPVRKSPRLQGKNKKNGSNSDKENNIQANLDKSIDKSKDTTLEAKDEEPAEPQASQKNRLSIASSDLINNLKTEAKTETVNLNKSTSAIENQKNVKPKRKRTKSWTTITVSNESNFYSDNEEVKKKIKEGSKVPLAQIEKFNSGDGPNTSLDQDKADKSISKKKKKNSNSFVVEDIDSSMTNLNKSVDKKNDEKDKSLLNNQNEPEKNNVIETIKLFEKEPSSNIHTMILIEEDSDTNSGKLSIKNRYENEDQCVPVVQHTSQMEKEISQYSLSSDKITNGGNKSKDAIIMNDSCEPMDVDETIPESLLMPEIKANEINSNLHLDKNESKENLNQSKRKSSISHLNKSGNENKSTLILSQLKDTSADNNNVTKSPRKSNVLSKTMDELNTSQENDINKRNISLNYAKTSTPLQQKHLQKLGGINTSIISSNNDAKNITKDKLNQSKNEITVSDNVDHEISNNKLDLNNSESINVKTDKINKSLTKDVKNNTKNSSDSTEDSDSEEESGKNKSKNIKSKSFNLSNKSKLNLNNSESNNDETDKNVNKNLSKNVKTNIKNLGDSTENSDSEEDSGKNESKNIKAKSLNKSKLDINNSESNNDKADKKVNKSLSKDIKNDTKKTSDSTEDSDSEEETGKNESKNIKSKSLNKSKLDLNNSKSISDKTNKNKSLSRDIKNNTKNAGDSTEDSDSEEETGKNIKSKSFNKSANQTVASNEDSDHESESDEESHKISNLMDDEAEDAGDDYESGDSQDESERQYLKENEILEKGETLTSENDLSNDSDYEKDSFVVSSDEEDNELLEGTEDDLSMSDNELKMTAKSKKKFNERKAKEQKKASREMYESRHKLNVSNVSSSSELGKSKKNKRQQLSYSESEDEKEVKTKKHNRMRLDSSHEVSLLEDKNENKKSNKKTKRLSESVCDDNAMNENEITVQNESLKESDPLSINVKEEPKTPNKGDSSIAFINAENDPNIESELTKTQTEIQDPLEESMDEDDSLSSDNENIMQNYDSVLEGLNETNKTKSKKCDISLNIDKKQKKKKNTTIVDELNLTQVKPTKAAKNKANKQKQKDSNTDNKTKKPDIDDGASSDSIDLHLLFSEDSNSSDNIQNKTNNDDSKAEQFIPLKRTEGKTDIRENADKSISNLETSLNISRNKKDKKSRKSETISTSDKTDENSVSFFIDTEGTLNNSLNKSKNNNKKKFSLENNDNENSDSDAPMDVPFIKEKRTSKVQANIDEEGADETDFAKDTFNKSVAKTPNSEKKKKKKARESQVLDQTAPENEKIEEELNTSSSRAKLNKSINEANKLTEQDVEPASDKSLIKTPSSQKKKKRMSQSITLDDEDAPTEVILNETTGSSKKKKQSSISLEDNPNEGKEESLNASILKTPSSQKKKKSLITQETEQAEVKAESLNASILKTPGSQKKKNKSLITQDTEQDDLIPETSLNNSKLKTPGSQKKVKVNESVEHKEADNEEKDHDTTLSSGKISKKSLSNSFTVENILSSPAVDISATNDTSAKKRKRKSSLNNPTEETVPEDETNTSKKLNESLVGSQKKKRKISQHDEIVSAAGPTLEENHLQSLNSKESKLKKETQNTQNITEMPKKNRNKRKQREDDEEPKVIKIAKENSFDKVHVPRLPDTILKQLDDKPRQIPSTLPKKPKVVSTTQFSVVEAKKRRNKPSNYLEESVYLNDDESMDKKKKKRLDKPKVLPFVPTALTSTSGYTTNFKINVIPKETKFVAQSNTTSNFKDDYLFNKKIKRQGTYELYKRSRNIKISKF